jgi:hypothetical protein
LQAELNRSSARLATCLRIERRDGNVYGFTTNRKRLLIDGVEYMPNVSFTPSDIATGSSLDNDDLEVMGDLLADVLTEDDAPAAGTSRRSASFRSIGRA